MLVALVKDIESKIYNMNLGTHSTPGSGSMTPDYPSARSSPERGGGSPGYSSGSYSSPMGSDDESHGTGPPPPGGSGAPPSRAGSAGRKKKLSDKMYFGSSTAIDDKPSSRGGSGSAGRGTPNRCVGGTLSCAFPLEHLFGLACCVGDSRSLNSAGRLEDFDEEEEDAAAASSGGGGYQPRLVSPPRLVGGGGVPAPPAPPLGKAKRKGSLANWQTGSMDADSGPMSRASKSSPPAALHGDIKQEALHRDIRKGSASLRSLGAAQAFGDGISDGIGPPIGGSGSGGGGSARRSRSSTGTMQSAATKKNKKVAGMYGLD